jgi:hypothetical protein
MWNCSVAVSFGTPLIENTGELRPHHRKFIEKADEFAVLIINSAAAQTPKRKRMHVPRLEW